MKAYELMRQLDPGRVAKPPTIHRALHQLVAAGLVHKVLSRDAYAACARPAETHQPVFLTCELRGRAAEAFAQPDHLQQLAAGQLRIVGAVLELTGRCGECG